MATQTLTYLPAFEAVRGMEKFRFMDLMVSVVGIAIACCGYFAVDVSWLLAHG